MDLRYDDHVTIFLDLLGFSQLISELKPDRALRILQLLSDLSSLKGDFSITKKYDDRYDDWRKETTHCRPAVSTFSDNIVISYPVSELDAEFDNRGVGMAIALVTRLIAKLSAEALRVGLLTRGAATVGKLHHSAGVVFGEAMVDAYRLESTVAIYPRLVASAALKARLDAEDKSFLRDFDGLFFLDYYRDMFFTSVGDDPETFTTEFISWDTEARAVIDDSISRFRLTGQLNPLAKWEWFKSRFEAARTLVPEQFFDPKFQP